MYKTEVDIDEVIDYLKANHPLFCDTESVKIAYAYAKEKHDGQVRKSGEAYIYHPIRVAKLIAEWGFSTQMVIAALLHDVVEDCGVTNKEISDKFKSDVANLVDTLTAVSDTLKNKENLSKEELDKLDDINLLKTMSENALFIKVADRIDNLNTIGIMPRIKQCKKAQHTREILIPYVKEEQAYALVDELEELCFKIEHPERYAFIQSLVDKIVFMNKITLDSTLNLFSKTFSTTAPSPISAQEPHEYQACIIDFTYNLRSIISIFRQLSREATNLRTDIPKLLTKRNFALYDLTLVIDTSKIADNQTPIDIFFKYYQDVLMKNDICIISYNHHSTYQDSDYIVLQDKMYNLYRLFVRSEKSYRHYKMGKAAEETVTNIPLEVDPVDPRDSYKKKIKVFKRDGSSMMIDEGSSVLDFAFYIHSDVGIHFDYALIDNDKMNADKTNHRVEVYAYYRLQAGDQVEIFTKQEPAANILWFRYLKTNRAIQHLTKYIQRRCKLAADFLQPITETALSENQLNQLRELYGIFGLESHK